MIDINGHIGVLLKEIAKLLKANVRVKNACVDISRNHFCVKVCQMENYDERLLVTVILDGKVSLFWDEVKKAIDPDFNQEYVEAPAGSYNEIILSNVVQFIRGNRDKLLAFPPEWFLPALEISVEKTKKHFPEVAKKDWNDGIELWKRWKGNIL